VLQLLKRWVFRDCLKELKESPGRRSPGGRSFHSRGPAAEKLLSPSLLCVQLITKNDTTQHVNEWRTIRRKRTDRSRSWERLSRGLAWCLQNCFQSCTILLSTHDNSNTRLYQPWRSVSIYRISDQNHRDMPSVNVKRYSDTRHRAMGPELIPVYRQSAHRWLFKSSPVVGCHYFLPGLRSPSQPKNVTVLRPVPSYTAWWERHIGVNNLSKVAT